MKDINPEDFKVTSAVNIADISSDYTGDYSDEKLEKELEEVREKLGKWQDKMYADNRYSVLICLQGMDTSGKDSLIREVFKEFNVRGVVVHSFKVPTSAELQHDYLWRHYIALPERGKFGIFNRSHYENVLVTKVHPEYILNENLPDIQCVEDITNEFWEKRYKQIVAFENHLAENGTLIFKFFLHLSKDEQKERLLRRLEKESHNWKFSVGDLKEREHWSQYMKYYEEALNKTSTEKAPWYVVPADNKAACRYIVAEILWQELKKYSIDEPELEAKVKENLELYKNQLVSS